MKNKQQGSVTIVALAFIVLWVAAVIGWCINLYEVIVLAVAAVPVTTLFVLKAVGIVVAPLGAFLGLFF